MKDESMFARLYGYEEPVFREEHPVVEFETADGCTEYTVFAVLRLYKDDPWYDFFPALPFWITNVFSHATLMACRRIVHLPSRQAQ